jgi:hypothetical protein
MLKKSWKTSLFGLAAVVTALGQAYQQLAVNHQPVTIGNLGLAVLPIALTALGLHQAKDKNVTGGNVSNGLTPPTIAKPGEQISAGQASAVQAQRD